MTTKELKKAMDIVIELWSEQLNKIEFNGTTEALERFHHKKGMIQGVKMLREKMENSKKQSKKTRI